MDRRSYLRAAGAVIALPPLASLGSESPAEQATSSIKRMVCVANDYGMYPEAWRPKQVGPDYETPRLLKPLAPHREHFTVCTHLDHGVFGAHVGAAAFLCGYRPVDPRPRSADFRTLDLVAAEFVGQQTHLPVLRLGRSWSYDARGAVVPPIPSVGSAFETMFVAPSKSSIARQRQRMENDRSILDAVLEQSRSVQRQLNKHDSSKMDDYLAAIRAVEKKISDANSWLEKPRPKVDLSIASEVDDLKERVPLIYELIALALQTDATRVATFGFALDNVADLSLRYSYHEYSHHGSLPELVDGLLKIEMFQMRHLANFLGRLKSIDEPDGSSLLDNTMVLFGSGLGNGSSHSCRNLPILLAGGGFRHGSHRSFKTSNSESTPLCNLMLTMLRKFGSQAEQFGTSTGEISDL